MNQAARQLGLALGAIVLSSALVLGSLMLSFVEGGARLALVVPAGSATLMPLASHTPTPFATQVPGEPTFTPQPPPTNTPAASPTAGCTAPDGWIQYIVQVGDSLESLAVEFGTTVQTLVQGNCLPGEQIIADMQLYVPVPVPTQQISAPTSASTVNCGPPRNWVSIVLKPGDNLYQLSKTYGVTEQELQRANCLGSSILINAGKKFYVPFAIPATSTPTPTRTPSPTATVTQSAVPSATRTPTITIIKTASDNSIPESGQPVTFTFVVTNNSLTESVTITSLVDSVFGPLAGDGNCNVGTNLAAGASCEFSITELVEGDASGPVHNNVVTVTAKNKNNFTITDTDDERITFEDVAPAITVAKTASDSSIPESGQDVTFTIVVTNDSTYETVTITSLVDSVFGPLAGDGDCNVGSDLAAGASCEFSFTERVEGDASGPAHVNVFTAKAVDNDNTEAIGNDNATVDFEDVAPTILVTKTANPTAVPETGGLVLFTFVVENTSTKESVTITSLIDSIFGSLTGDADCKVGSILAPFTSCTFTSERTILSEPNGKDHYNVVTVEAEDNDSSPATDTDDETIIFEPIP